MSKRVPGGYFYNQQIAIIRAAVETTLNALNRILTDNPGPQVLQARLNEIARAQIHTMQAIKDLEKFADDFKTSELKEE